MKSPLPTPIFYDEKSFSSKKERAHRSIVRPPPTPRVRYSSLGRFSNSSNSDRPRSISFRNSNCSLSSNYDSNSDIVYFHQCFQVMGVLGSGSFADVYKVKCLEDRKLYAVKKANRPFASYADRERKLQEVQKLEQLPRHPNCVKFYKAWEEQQILYIQFELCLLSLSQYADKNHEIAEEFVWSVVCDMLHAIKHLHDHDLIHFDIKPANIFLTEDGTCKLGDFGLVRDVKRAKKDCCEGDAKYVAKEVIDGKYTKAADIFSLGITTLELALDLELPSRGESWLTLRKLRVPPDLQKNLSLEMNEIINIMIEPDYKKRMSAGDILQLNTIKNVLKEREKNGKMNLSLHLYLPEPSESDRSVFSEFSSSISDDVFESIPSPMNHAEVRPIKETIPLVGEVLPNNRVEISRPLCAVSTPRTRSVFTPSLHCNVSTPSSYHRLPGYHTSGSPSFSGTKRKQISSPTKDCSPARRRSPRKKLFFNSSDEEGTTANQPVQNLSDVFNALSSS